MQSPAEVRGQRGRAGEWDLTQGQWVTDICPAHSGVWRGTPSSRWASREGEHEGQGECIHVCHIWGEKTPKLVIPLPCLNIPFSVHTASGACKHTSLLVSEGKDPLQFNFISHHNWIQKPPARMPFMGNKGSASQQGAPRPRQRAICRHCLCDVSRLPQPSHLENGRPSF